MAWTLQDCQNLIASEVDQSATAPTVGGTDWSIRSNFINRALIDWSESYDWECMKKVFNGLVSTSSGNASYALPADFRKLDGYPQIVADGSNTYAFPQVDPSHNNRYTSSDYFVNILGNKNSGMVMYVHACTLASGASVQFTYYASPATLSAVSDIAVVPDPTFLVQRALYYLLKSREDGRFPEAKTESDRILARMIENENTLGMASADRRVSVGSEDFKTWRIGRD